MKTQKLVRTKERTTSFLGRNVQSHVESHGKFNMLLHLRSINNTSFDRNVLHQHFHYEKYLVKNPTDE